MDIQYLHNNNVFSSEGITLTTVCPKRCTFLVFLVGYLSLSISMHNIHIFIYIYIYIYIYMQYLCILIYVYICIDIYIDRNQFMVHWLLKKRKARSIIYSRVMKTIQCTSSLHHLNRFLATYLFLTVSSGVHALLVLEPT